MTQQAKSDAEKMPAPDTNRWLPIKYTIAPAWKCLLARLLGRKVMGEDQGFLTTAYQWRGKLYVWSMKDIL